MTASALTPMLTVKNAVAAIDFYCEAFAAVELERFTTPTGQVVAELAIDVLKFYAVDENPAAFNVSPGTLGGTTVRINLIVDDPDAVAARAIAAGATEVFPVGDQPYGMRQGRVADPDAVADRAVAAGARVVFPVDDQPYGMRQGRIADPAGHHWLIGKRLR